VQSQKHRSSPCQVHLQRSQQPRYLDNWQCKQYSREPGSHRPSANEQPLVCFCHCFQNHICWAQRPCSLKCSRCACEARRQHIVMPAWCPETVRNLQQDLVEIRSCVQAGEELRALQLSKQVIHVLRLLIVILLRARQSNTICSSPVSSKAYSVVAPNLAFK